MKSFKRGLFVLAGTVLMLSAVHLQAQDKGKQPDEGTPLAPVCEGGIPWRALTWADFKGDVPEEQKKGNKKGADLEKKLAELVTKLNNAITAKEKADEKLGNEKNKFLGKWPGGDPSGLIDDKKAQIKANLEYGKEKKEDVTKVNKSIEEAIKKIEKDPDYKEYKEAEDAVKEAEKAVKEDEEAVKEAEKALSEFNEGEGKNIHAAATNYQIVPYFKTVKDEKDKDYCKATVTVKVFFCPKGSWSIINKQSPALLKHEQGHLDIAQIYGRKLLKELETITAKYNENVSALVKQLRAANGPAQCNPIIEKINKAKEDFAKEREDAYKKKWKENDKEEDLYDTQTKHSKDPNEQEKWNEKINEGLKPSQQ